MSNLFVIIKYIIMDIKLEIVNLLMRFAINLLACIFITYVAYQRVHRKRGYDFSFMMLSSVILFLCFFLSGVELQLGLALGLFAIFGIIRYRTDAMPIREMTYLFMVIALSVINALIDMQNLLWETLFVNGVFISLPLIIESLKKDTKEQIIVTYDDISLAGKDKREELLKDLEKKLNVNIIEVQIQKIDISQAKMKLVIVVEN